MQQHISVFLAISAQKMAFQTLDNDDMLQLDLEIRLVLVLLSTVCSK